MNAKRSRNWNWIGLASYSMGFNSRFDKVAQTNATLLYAQFMRSGIHSAREALELFIADNDNIEGIALYSGIALESWAKATLAQEHPALVLVVGDRSNDRTLRMAVGLVDISGARERIRTISGEDACERVKWLNPNFPYSRQSGDDIVFIARNAAAHGGPVNRSEAVDALSCMVRLVNWIACNIMVMHSGRAFALWGEHCGAAQELAEHHEQEQLVRVRALIAAAKGRYIERYGEVDPTRLADAFASVTPRRLSSDDPSVLATRTECPSCGQRAWLYVEDEERNTEEARGADSILLPIALECHVCELELDDIGLQFVGLDQNIQWSAANKSNFFKNHDH